MASWMVSFAGLVGIQTSRPVEPLTILSDMWRMAARPAGPVGPWLELTAAALALLWAGRCAAALLLPCAGRALLWLATGVCTLVLQNLSVLALSLGRAVRAGPELAVALLLGALLTPAGLRSGAWRRARPDGPDQGPARASRRVLAWLAGAAGAAALLWYGVVVLLGLKLPDVGWDALAQHGAAAAFWLQHGGVSWIRSDDYWLNVYPMNTEVALLWQLALLRRDNLLSLVQLPYALLGACASYVLARHWGAPRAGAALAALCFLLVPNTIVQARTAYVDVAFGALCLTALALWDAARRWSSAPAWLLVGMALGLLAGTKPTGLLYGGALGIAVLLSSPLRGMAVRRALPYRAAPVAAAAEPNPEALGADPGERATGDTARRGRGRRAGPQWWQRALLCLLPALALGLWWYGRTWLATGNPLYPFPVVLAGRTLFAGPMRLQQLLDAAVPAAYRGRSDGAMLWLAWRGVNVNGWYISRQGWLGLAWPYAELPALVLWALRGARRAGAWPVLLVVAVIFLLQPHNWDPRYTLWLPPLGAAALVAQHWPRRWEGWVHGWLTVLAVCGSLAAAPRLLASVAAAEAVPPAQRQPGSLFDEALYGWTATKLRAGDRIGYAEGPTLLLPLFGQRLDRRVISVAAATRSAWLRRLQAERITVFVTQDGSYPNRYLNWMRGVPARPLHPGPVVYAWRLRPPGGRNCTLNPAYLSNSSCKRPILGP